MLEILPGVYNAQSALLARQAGFENLFLSGAALSATMLGRADLGLLTPSELADTTARIRERVDCRLLVDGDAGHGGTHNLHRLVRMLAAAGADAIQIEDQRAIKPRGNLLARPLVTPEEMIDRIRAAVDARPSENLKISARTDAAPVHGLEAAIERAHRYAEAGADYLFVQALNNQDEADRVSGALGSVRPLVIHLPEPGKLGDFDFARLNAGFRLGLQPSVLMGAATRAMQEALVTIGGRIAISGFPAHLGGEDGFWHDE